MQVQTDCAGREVVWRDCGIGKTIPAALNSLSCHVILCALTRHAEHLPGSLGVTLYVSTCHEVADIITLGVIGRLEYPVGSVACAAFASYAVVALHKVSHVCRSAREIADGISVIFQRPVGRSRVVATIIGEIGRGVEGVVSNLTNLFRVMIFRPNAFKIELGFCHLNSRDFFEEWKRRINTEDFHNPYFEEELRLTEVLYDIDVAKAVLEIQKRIENDCDLHRAATFLKLIRHSYSSSCKSFASQPFDISKLYDGIEQLAIRMNNAVVENQDFETLIKHYDREDSFFYCDPPYFSSEYVYDCGFTWEDHVRLHDALVNAKGKWLLSYNDCPEIRELYKGYSFYDFKRVHSMVQKYDPGKEFPELLIANYDLTEKAKNFSWQIDLFTPIEAIKDIDTIMKESMRYNAKRICRL